MWNAIVSQDHTSQILSAWIAKEELRTLLSTVRVGGAPNLTRHRLHRFLSWCIASQIPSCSPWPPPSTPGGPKSTRSSRPASPTPAPRLQPARQTGQAQRLRFRNQRTRPTDTIPLHPQTAAATRLRADRPVKIEEPRMPGPLPPPLPAACWKYKPPLDDVIVGEAAEIGLDVWVCAGAELPSDITVEAASGSNNVALSGPAEIERSQTSQSWVWRRPSILPVSTECLSQCAVPTWKTRRSIRSSVLTPRRAFGAASWTHYQAVVRR